MLTIVLPETEMFDEETQMFITAESITFELEHSLVSLSKWESITNKPFLGRDAKSYAEVIEYVRCMTITPGVPAEAYSRLTNEHYEAINGYMNARMSATWFNDDKKPTPKEIITAELIYYWMIELNIPFECETWHLDRLFTLIKVVNLKRQPAKKMSRREIGQRQRALNEQRLAQLGTKG